MARGKSRSDTIENAVANTKKIASTGVKEIVLTGVNLGDFGYGVEIGTSASLSNQNTETPYKKRKDYNFLDLIKALDEIDGIERIRISSIEPNLLTDEVIEFVAQSKRFVPHFHIPLQSGNDAVLAKMKRRYKRQLYADRVAKIKSLMPQCCIGVDVIVGFPTETQEQFMDTYNFINNLDVSYLHVFTYSERDNTEALHFTEVVDYAERKRRNKQLRMLSAKKLHAFYEQHLGNTFTVLFEHENKNGIMNGFTENYIKVTYPYTEELVNQSVIIKTVSINEDGLVAGELVLDKIIV